MLGNMCIVIIYSPVCDVIVLVINLAFLASPFPIWLNKLEQKFKYIQTKKVF